MGPTSKARGASVAVQREHGENWTGDPTAGCIQSPDYASLGRDSCLRARSAPQARSASHKSAPMRPNMSKELLLAIITAGTALVVAIVGLLSAMRSARDQRQTQQAMESLKQELTVDHE